MTTVHELTLGSCAQAKLQIMSITSTLSVTPSDLNQTEPAFWDHLLGSVPWCNQLLTHFELIQKELGLFIQNGRPFMDYPKYGNLYSNTWEAFPLSVFEGEFISLAKGQLGFDLNEFVTQARGQLPELSNLLEGLEAEGHLRNVFVSRLLPGSVIHPHRGWTPEFLRIHLGLKCDPLCRITVGQTTRTWETGKFLAFRDGGPYLHSVKHQGTQERIVLSIDLRMSYVSQFFKL